MYNGSLNVKHITIQIRLDHITSLAICSNVSFDSRQINKNKINTVHSGDLKSGSQMVEKSLGSKWSGFQMGSEIRKPNHFKSKQMAAILHKTIWNLDKNIQILNGSVF